MRVPETWSSPAKWDLPWVNSMEQGARSQNPGASLLLTAGGSQFAACSKDLYGGYLLAASCPLLAEQDFP